jgi:hypothetical protein
MPHAQDDDAGLRKFVTHLELTNDDSAHLARREGIQLLADPWKITQPIRRADKLLYDARGRPGRCSLQELMQWNKG